MASPFIAHAAPIIETIRSRGIRNFVLHGGAVRKRRYFSGAHLHAIALPGSFAFTTADRYVCGVAIGVDIETILAGSGNGERHIGRVDFIDFPVIEASNPKVERSLVEFHLDCL